MFKSFLLFVIVMSAVANGTFAQRCEQSDLSNKFNYIITTVKKKNADSAQAEISQVFLQIVGKANKKQIQQIAIKPAHLFDDAFTDCSAARSYITGKNKDAEAEDNDFGDFIVADFNFDNREDFAVKWDSGGNGGPTYEFYTQNKSGKFQKDSFLTGKMGFFPGTIDTRRKRLITYVHADVAGYHENIYKYNPVTRKWISLKPIYRKAGQ
jgi:hypothetical protein